MQVKQLHVSVLIDQKPITIYHLKDKETDEMARFHRANPSFYVIHYK